MTTICRNPILHKRTKANVRRRCEFARALFKVIIFSVFIFPATVVSYAKTPPEMGIDGVPKDGGATNSLKDKLFDLSQDPYSVLLDTDDPYRRSLKPIPIYSEMSTTESVLDRPPKARKEASTSDLASELRRAKRRRLRADVTDNSDVAGALLSSSGGGCPVWACISSTDVLRSSTLIDPRPNSSTLRSFLGR